MGDKSLSRRRFLALGSGALFSGAVPQVAPARPAAGERGLRIMSAGSQVLESRFGTVGAGTMHWLAGGAEDSMPLVLVHGLALSGQYTVPLAEAMARDHQVFAPDLPGFGDTYKPGRVLDVSGLANALLDWLASMALPPVVLAGNSFGSQIIVEAAHKQPESVRAMVLQGPTTPIEERTWYWQFIRWRQNAPNNPPLMGEVADIDYAKCGFARALQTFEFSLRDRPEDKLADIAVPTLVLRGADDPICHQHWAELLAERSPQGQLIVLPDMAHTLVFTHPEEMRSEIIPFLAQFY